MTSAELVRLSTLQPDLQRLYKLFENDAWRLLGIRIYLASGTRTFEEQRDLYAQGRTRSGPVVTRAKPGQSWHNFGLAFDIAWWNKDQQLDWNISDSLGACGVSLGLEWGGRWEHRDDDHFQRLNGLTLGSANTQWPGGWRVLSS